MSAIDTLPDAGPRPALSAAGRLVRCRRGGLIASSGILLASLLLSACGGGLVGSEPSAGSEGTSSPVAAPAASDGGGDTTAIDPAADDADADADADAGAAPSDEEAADVGSDLAVPGYAVGEIPAIPLFAVPDVSMVNSKNADAVVEIAEDLPDVEGITIAPARCDDSGAVISGGSTILYGDGAAVTEGEDGSVVNHGDGSGAVADGDGAVVNHGDGSGTYTDDDVSIITFTDGSGTYASDELNVVLNGDGSGTHTAGAVATVNHGDGSGTYTDGRASIVNDGDGSGTYTDDTHSIVNDGEGSATVNGVVVDAEPLAPVPEVGRFPAMEAFAPQESCGVMITLADSVLFDFGKADLRPESQDVLEDLSGVLTELEASNVVISGHTDSIGSDEFNQDLSERRAAAVTQSLTAGGVPSLLETIGHGESQPVAANENPDGSDNPAGRQLNRRVEIFVPNA